jgi:uncharacterized membrane protein YbaN (DUF454 family)
MYRLKMFIEELLIIAVMAKSSKTWSCWVMRETLMFVYLIEWCTRMASPPPLPTGRSFLTKM